MQELWRKQVNWDDPLDPDFQCRWHQMATNLEEAANIVLPCRYFALSSNKPIRLHVFADASTKVYGAVAYLQNANNVAFVMAKSQVSPLKNLTLPRLEFKATVTATQLAASIVSALQDYINNIQVKLWSDSKLHCIGFSAANSSSSLWPIMSNRSVTYFLLQH